MLRVLSRVRLPSFLTPVLEGENRVLGFAYLGAAFSFSRLVASLIGGLAAGYDLPFGLLEGNPYALPSFIGTLFNASSFIMAVLFIPETLSQAQKANAKKNPTVHTDVTVKWKADCNAETRGRSEIHRWR